MTEVSALPNAGALTGAEYLALLQAGGAVKIPLSRILTRTTGGGSIITGVASSEGLPRDDAGLAIVAPSGSHGLILFKQPNGADEWAIVGFHPDSTGAYRQTGTDFRALQGGVNSVGSFRPYMAQHGESYRGDYTPLITYMDNAVEVCCGPTGGTPFNAGYTNADWFHNFQFSWLQGGAVLGVHSQSLQSQYILQANGFGHFGTVDATTKVSTKGVSIGWSAGSTAGLVQAMDTSAGTLEQLNLTGSTIVLGGGHILPDTDNARNLGSGSKRIKELFCANPAINTSDANLKLVREEPPTDAERAWAAAIAKLAAAYRWRDSAAEKGDAARLHFGAIAQEVEAAGIAAGIADPFAYAFLCNDPVMETVSMKLPVDRQKTRRIKVAGDTIEIIDGKPVLVAGPQWREEPVWRQEPVFDADGKPVMVATPPVKHETGLFDAQGNPAIFYAQGPEVQRTHPVPDIETVMVEQDVEQQARDPEGNLRWQMGLRYVELDWFLRWAGQ